MKYLNIIVFVLFALQSHSANAQGAKEDGHFSQFGVFMGKMLPNGLDSEDEIFSLSGLRYSSPIGKGNGYADFGAIMGNGDGVKWQGAFVSVSMHIPVETLIGHAGVGLDFTRYETSETDAAKNIGGGHFIGGIMSKIGGNVLARFDMKLNSKPGTSLFFGFGLVFEFDGAGDGAE